MTIKDPNLRFPKNPTLVDDLDVFEMPDGLGMQVRGGATNLVVRGRLAVSLIPWLIGELKQKTSLENLIKSRPAGSHEAEIEELLLLLVRKGYLVDAETKGASAGTASHSLDAKQRLFWGRKLGFTRNNTSAQEVESKLKGAKVVLVADGLLGCCTFDILHRSGINTIEVIDRLNNTDLKKLVEDAQNNGMQASYTPKDTLDTLAELVESKVETADLLVTATRNAPQSFFNRINQISLETPIDWLRANESTVELEIGPLVVPRDTACYTCYVLRTRSASDHPIEESLYSQHMESLQNSEKPMQGESLAFATAGGAQISMEVIRAITKISLPVTVGAVIFNTFDGHTEQLKVKKVARCPDCFGGAVDVRGEVQPERDSAYA
jgi:bacteriocin biosynthesis cyclodehydratase domain-containing protein